METLFFGVFEFMKIVINCPNGFWILLPTVFIDTSFPAMVRKSCDTFNPAFHQVSEETFENHCRFA